MSSSLSFVLRTFDLYRKTALSGEEGARTAIPPLARVSKKT